LPQNKAFNLILHNFTRILSRPQDEAIITPAQCLVHTLITQLKSLLNSIDDLSDTIFAGHRGKVWKIAEGYERESGRLLDLSRGDEPSAIFSSPNWSPSAFMHLDRVFVLNGVDLSNHQIGQQLNLNKDDVQ
jgi:hypothetical protein